MEASQGSDPSTSVKNDAAGKILPLHTGAGFDWMEFFVFFVGYISTWHLGYESLTTDWNKVVESVQEKIERLKRYSIANAKVVQTFYQAAIGCLEARQVIMQHAQEDPVERNAFTHTPVSNDEDEIYSESVGETSKVAHRTKPINCASV